MDHNPMQLYSCSEFVEYIDISDFVYAFWNDSSSFMQLGYRYVLLVICENLFLCI